jgi:hypothetical protein
MKKILIALGLISLSQAAIAQGVHVDGYTRRDGTYVAPHYRSAPDSHYNNNWGVSPNINPYTGQQGAQQPTWNDRPPPSNYLYGSPYGFGTRRR